MADEAAVLSRSGAVHFSVRRTAQEIAERLEVPAIAEEVARRGTALPALRLPFDGPGPAADLPVGAVGHGGVASAAGRGRRR